MRNSVAHVKETPHGDVLTTASGRPLFGLKTDRFSGLIQPEDTTHRLNPDGTINLAIPTAAIEPAVELLIPVSPGIPYEVLVQAQINQPTNLEGPDVDVVAMRLPQVFREDDYVNPETGEIAEEANARFVWAKNWVIPPVWLSNQQAPYLFESAQVLATEDTHIRATLDAYHYNSSDGTYRPAEGPVEVIRAALSVKELML